MNAIPPITNTASEHHNRVYPEARLCFSNGKRFFGPGPYALLVLVEKTSSLRDACTEMGMSYTKGWKMLRNAEEQLGLPIVHKKRGGVLGGSTILTAEGKLLLEKYDAFNRESQQLIAEVFDKHLMPLFSTDARTD